VQERRIGFAGAVIDPFRLGQGHAYDAWPQRYERHGVGG
jgi:hypothetical protein